MVGNDDKVIYSGLRIWLRGFFPIHGLFCEAFNIGDCEAVSYGLFRGLVDALGPVINAVDIEAKGESSESE